MRWQLGLQIILLFAYVWADEEEEPVEEEAVKEEFKDLSHGFGTDIEWVDFSKANQLSEELKKPVFVLIHKTWCGACKQLKNSFKSSPKHHDFVKLSRKFVMVNLEDDEEPEDDKFAPDGRYIPRLYFLKNGDLLDVKNKNYPSNLYYFPQLQDVVKAMEEALKLYNKDEEAEKVEEKPKKTEEKKEKPKKETEKKETEDKKKEKTDTKKDSKKKETEKKAETKTDAKKDSKKKETEKKSDNKKDETKKTDTKKTDNKKEETKKTDTKKTDTKKADDKKADKKKSEEAECPHAKKAREEKEKKQKKKEESDSKAKNEDGKKKDSKSTKQTKKSEL